MFIINAGNRFSNLIFLVVGIGIFACSSSSDEKIGSNQDSEVKFFGGDSRHECLQALANKKTDKVVLFSRGGLSQELGDGGRIGSLDSGEFNQCINKFKDIFDTKAGSDLNKSGFRFCGIQIASVPGLRGNNFVCRIHSKLAKNEIKGNNGKCNVGDTWDTFIEGGDSIKQEQANNICQFEYEQIFKDITGKGGSSNINDVACKSNSSKSYLNVAVAAKIKDKKVYPDNKGWWKCTVQANSLYQND